MVRSTSPHYYNLIIRKKDLRLYYQCENQLKSIAWKSSQKFAQNQFMLSDGAMRVASKTGACGRQ
jgi:predicted alternative tryptophan synthase beta-subunit